MIKDGIFKLDKTQESLPATDPLVSPIFANQYKWPPLLIHTSENDLHFDDALVLAEKGAKRNGQVQMNYWDSPRHHLERLSSRMLPGHILKYALSSPLNSKPGVRLALACKALFFTHCGARG